MIRLVYCVARREDVPLADFRRAWNGNDYRRLIAVVASFYEAKRHVLNVTLSVDLNARIMAEQGTGEPFDGIVEFWWDDAKTIEALNETPEAQALRRQLDELEAEFVDRSQSRLFFTESG